MANIFTPLLGLTKQITGENPNGIWGETLNSGFMELVEEAISGTTEVDVGSADQVLTNDQGVTNQARAMILIATGAPGVQRTIIVPSTQKMYCFQNDSDDEVIVRTNPGSGVTVAAADRKVLIVDAVLDDVVEVTAGITNSITPAGDYDAATNPGTWQNVTAGVADIYAPTLTQGQIGGMWLPTSFPPLTIAATDFIWLPTDVLGGSTTGASWLGAVPASDEEYIIWIDENGTAERCVVVLPSDGLQISIEKCDGSAWINGSTRELLDGVFGGFEQVLFPLI